MDWIMIWGIYVWCHWCSLLHVCIRIYLVNAVMFNLKLDIHRFNLTNYFTNNTANGYGDPLGVVVLRIVLIKCCYIYSLYNVYYYTEK